uniref:Uncharacterized protein n=1 Tax=Glossina palpalis gambiensis TaxID=67801 RepID=A0A1B0AX15_9MUSC
EEVFCNSTPYSAELIVDLVEPDPCSEVSRIVDNCLQNAFGPLSRRLNVSSCDDSMVSDACRTLALRPVANGCIFSFASSIFIVVNVLFFFLGD